MRSLLLDTKWRLVLIGLTLLAVFFFIMAFKAMIDYDNGIRSSAHNRSWWDNFFVGGFFITFATIISLTGYFLLVWFAKGVVFLFSKFSSFDYADFSNSRRGLLRNLGVIAGALPFVSVLYAVTKGKHDFKIWRESLTYKDLPKDFDGFKIVQISDLHLGTFHSTSVVEQGVELIRSLGADLVLFTGDLVNSHYEEALPYLDVLNQISVPYGQYSVLGNHDYGRPYYNFDSEESFQNHVKELKNCHEKMGFIRLDNEHVVLEKGGSKICLAGCENWGDSNHFPKTGDLYKTFENVPDDLFTILMSHDPTHWDHVNPIATNILKFQKKIHLTLSGHTHGMQLGLELPFFRWSPVKYRYKNWAGLYEQEDQKLYVNRGFGEIGFPGRLGMWPEITMITLKKG